jgi:hypothetical protein
VAELEREIRELEYQAGQERDLLHTLRATAKSRVELDQKQRRYKHDKEVREPSQKCSCREGLCSLVCSLLWY